ncbi:hypothetical protein GQ55_4G240500 [Panicum hallii var. hallii]|uniref:Uncharacterized protein n=1 Tax=Panicum hallii var. hallii TaxID=1504633 RepID=A0A2T7DZR3_9POAL|nr:hypothetical protein GQ55_4G240500 [Panicum hallii var. hallii]
MEYVDRFEEMVSLVRRHNPSLHDCYYISSFISNLKDYIQYHLQCYRPIALSQNYCYAKRLEQAMPNNRKITPFSAVTKPQKPKNKERETQNQTIADLRAAGKCFKCRETWVPGYQGL